MGKRVILHIGTMKTGTSFVQSILTRHPDELAAGGALFLGGNRRFYDQTRASRDLLKLPQKPKANLRKWRALAEQARTTDAETSIMSMEFLSFLGPEQVRLAVEELKGLDVRMLLTVRDQRSAIPAQWQTYVRNYGTDDWGRYLGRIQAPAGRSRARKTFHRAQGVVPILERWGGTPGVDGVDVVTVPPPGGPKEELWNRFCDAAGIEVGPVDVDGVRANPSVGYASCDFLRQLNVHLEDIRPKRYRKAIRPLAVKALVPLRGEESRPELDRKAGAWAIERNRQLRTAIDARGYRLVGDLADLPVDVPVAELPRGVAPVPPEQLLRAARAGWAHAAELAGESTATPPESVDELVSECARLLHVAHGWDGNVS